MSKVYENRLRRIAARLGLRLHHSRVRKIHLHDRGGWRVTDEHDHAVAGERHDLMTLEAVEAVLRAREAELARERA